MKCTFRKVKESDGEQVIAIFNYYIENGFAASLENILDPGMFPSLMELTQGYPFYVIVDGHTVIGFGFLGKYHPGRNFDRVAELTYFILPEYTRRGLGTQLLKHLISDAKQLGIETLLGNINSLNQASLEFHRRQGFTECGRFERIGQKMGTIFDVVWVQKFI